MKDFFLSYNKEDKSWAEWIAWILEDAGYTTVIQAWDFLPGSNFVLNMQQALENAETTIAVISKNYFESVYTQSEWATAYAIDPSGIMGKLIPVRIDDFKPKGLFAQIVYIDLTNSDDVSARKKLLAGIQKKRGKPKKIPEFPGPLTRNFSEQPKFPGKPKKIKTKIILAAITIILALFITTSIYLRWYTPNEEKNPQPKLTIASKYYFLEDLKQTSQILSSIAEEENLNKETKRVCLAFLAKVLVEDARIKDAEDAINRLLDLEPPLITIFPTQKHRKLQTSYETVRERRFNYAEDRSEVKAIAIYEFQARNVPKSKLKDYSELEFVANFAFTEKLQEKYTIVERVMLKSLLEELKISKTFSDEENETDKMNFDLEKLNQIIEPWVLLIEPVNWPKDVKTNFRLGKIIEATHYIFGEVIFKPPSEDIGKTEVMIMVWMYNVDTAQLRLAEQIQGDISDAHNIIELSKQLADKVCIKISKN
jgi:hypothetical protein